MEKEFDLVCIGAGPGGYVAAIKASQLGKKVAIVDISSERIGGVCLNEGCIPTKSIIQASKIYASCKNFSPLFNLSLSGARPQMKQIVANSQKVVEALRRGVVYLFKKNRITFIEGKAQLEAQHKVIVESSDGKKEILEAQDIILACGSRPKKVNGLEVDGEKIISSSQAIKLDYLPKNILIVGAGAIGVEFASLFSNFGSNVFLVELERNILPQEDEDISKALSLAFKKRKIAIYLESKISSLDKSKDSLKVEINTPKGKEEIGVDLVLVAAGRVPNTDFQDFSKLGIELTGDGFVKVDDYMHTSIDNVYAVGDITGTKMFAHTAYKQAEVAIEALCDKDSHPFNVMNIPSIIYSDIEVASVGLTEKEAKEQNLDYLIAKQPFKANARAVVYSQGEGLLKIIVDKKTKQFLGAHILGPQASEIIHQFVIAKSSGINVDHMATFSYGHPTFSEIAKDACLSIFQKPIHS